MNILTQKHIDRFWGYVDKENSKIFYNGTRCWEWKGTCPAGYGQFRVGKEKLKTHRLSYEMKFGDIPKGFLVCHHCDNSVCMNPDHLFLGTPQDNMIDMVSKGRHRDQKGEKNWNCKLSEEQVFEIRKMYSPFGKNGKNARELAKEFGVSNQHISEIVNYKSRA